MSRFTDKQIAALPITGRRYDKWEGTGAGFAVRVSEFGTKSFCLIYMFHGKRKRLILGRYPAMTLADARKKALDAQRLLADGIDPGEARRKRRDQYRQASEMERERATVATLAEEYIERHAKKYKKSWREDQRIIDVNILRKWRGRKANEIKRRDVVVLIDSILDRGRPVMAKRALSLLAQVFNFAMNRGLVDANPAAGYRLKTDAPASTRALEDYEIGPFWRALDTAKMTDHTRAALRLALLTGARPGEVAGLPWAEVDLTDRVWRLPAERAKNKRAISIPLSGLAVSILEELKTISPGLVVFPTPTDPDKSINRNSLGAALRISFETHRMPKGMQPLTAHDLRRSCRTGLSRIHIEPHVAEAALNHAPAQAMVRVYDLHDYFAERRRAMEAWADYILEKVAAAN